MSTTSSSSKVFISLRFIVSIDKLPYLSNFLHVLFQWFSYLFFFTFNCPSSRYIGQYNTPLCAHKFTHKNTYLHNVSEVMASTWVLLLQSLLFHVPQKHWNVHKWIASLIHSVSLRLNSTIPIFYHSQSPKCLQCTQKVQLV